MHKNILRLGFVALVTAGFIAALPYVSNGKNVVNAGGCANCGNFTNKWQSKWNGFKCPNFREVDVTNQSRVSGIVDSRYRRSSPFPGCADKVKVKVKCGACYKVTLKGKYDYNCDAPNRGKRKNEHQYADALFQFPNAWNGMATHGNDLFVFDDGVNGGNVRNILPDVNKFNEKYSSPTGDNKYEFYWQAPTGHEGDFAQLQMYIREYSCNSGSCKKFGHYSYIDNAGKINYSIEEVDVSMCKVCPVTQETQTETQSEE